MAKQYIFGIISFYIIIAIQLTQNSQSTLHEKSYFLFPNILKRRSFQKNYAGIWSFLYYQKRWYFFFTKLSSYSLDAKWKMIFLKKHTWKYIFFRRSEKTVFSKNSHWNMIFLVVLSGKMIFLFPENMFWFFRRKMKGDLSQKTYMEIYFLQVPSKYGLSKRNSTGIWSFLYYLERWYFFPGKCDIFSLDGKWKMIFLKKYMDNDIVCKYV